MTKMDKTSSSEEGAPDIEKMKEDIAALTSDLARLIKGLKTEAAGHVAKEASHLYDKLVDEGGKSMESIAREVKDRPLASLAIAFAIGFVCGRLLSR
jgi:ElaB/YqjD/DUF883 family membrane-anchored ribosome-binding protein